jgi:hypothetical protein
MPDSPAFRHKKLYEGGKRNTLHVYAAGGVEAYALQVHTAGGHRNVGPLLLKFLYVTNKSLVNAGIPKCRKKVSPASAFLPVVNFVSLASVFRHQGQSGTAGHGLVRHCPAMHFKHDKITK